MSTEPLSPIRWIDVILVIAATPFALLTGVPVLGFLAGAAVWIVARIGGHLIERRAVAARDPRKAAGLTLFGGLGRAWLIGLTILVVGLAGAREDGLTAAVLTFVAFTVYLAVGIVLRPQTTRSTNP